MDDIITGSIPMSDGEVTVLDKPGLGVELDDKKIKQFAAGAPIAISS